jgi:hypothetical protein
VDISAEPFSPPSPPLSPATAGMAVPLPGGAVPLPGVVGQPCPMCGELVKDASLIGEELHVLNPCGCAI